MATFNQKRNEISQRAAALPLVGDGELLDDIRTEQILLELKRNGSHILAHANTQVDHVIDELRPEWDQTESGQYLLSEGEITTVVARALRRGAGQAVSDIGSTLVDISTLEAAFTGTPPEKPANAA